MVRQILFVLSALLIAASGSAWALDHTPDRGIRVTPIPLVTQGATILGQDFRYPLANPDIRIYEIEIPVGRQTSLHRHAIPLVAYVTQGDLELDYGSKGKRVVKAGSSFVEALNWCHFGKPLGNQPVRIIGVYLGQKNPEQALSEDCKKPD